MEENQQLIIEERLELAAERICEIAMEPQKTSLWDDWMTATAHYLRELNIARLQKNNTAVSFHPPMDAFTGEELLLAQFLTEEYEDVQSSVFRGEVEWLTEFSELFLQLYGIAGMLADNGEERLAELKETIYWFYSDYSEDMAERLAEQLFAGLPVTGEICYIGYEPEAADSAEKEAASRKLDGWFVRFVPEPLFAWSRGLRQILPACVYTEPLQSENRRRRDTREAFFADPRYISRKIEAWAEALKKYPPKKAMSICVTAKTTLMCQEEPLAETEHRFASSELIYRRLEELDREFARLLDNTLQIEQRISI